MKKIRLKNYFVPLTFTKAPVRTVASPELAPVFVPKAGVVPALHQKSGYLADRSVIEDYQAHFLALKQAKLSSLTARSVF